MMLLQHIADLGVSSKRHVEATEEPPCLQSLKESDAIAPEALYPFPCSYLTFEESQQSVLRYDLANVVANELRHGTSPEDLAVHTHGILTPTSGERISGGLRNVADHDLGDLVLLDDLALARGLGGLPLRQDSAVFDKRALGFGGRVAAMKLATHLATAYPRTVALELAVRVDLGHDDDHAILEGRRSGQAARWRGPRGLQCQY